ncbi:hypothetical protein Pa4123_52050 [Phytohabitans aurantiacus]|uniref:Alpha/beta hydrolase n=2 Tax=Phytohabitans aurantiacus TaxID=3016789 RepID=A0ABQ5R1U8_9ACTN|nr:hypothetical protein Pa4123_52050 [Phytohabitans aurantiacus]
MAHEWTAALLGGVELAAGLPGTLSNRDIECVFYGDLFRPAGRFLGDDLPFLAAEDVDDPLEVQLLLAWWEAAARSDPGVPPPDGRLLSARATARAALLALANSRFFAHVSERMLVWWLKQVTLYFTQSDVRAAIQRRFASVVRSDTRVVVAHSLGSVVAYEALCAHPDWAVTDFVTLGSPLGVPHVILHRLTPAPQRDHGLKGFWPGSVRRWVNVTDDGDIVALQPRLRDVFGDRVTDVGINNGIAAHDVQRYLTAPEVGAAVLAGLP